MKKRNVKLLQGPSLKVTSVEEDKVMQLNDSHDSFAEGQVNDKEISTIISMMKNGQLDLEKPEALKQHERGLWQQRDKLRLRGDMLYILKDDTYRLIIAKRDTDRLIAAYHDKLGHLGQTKCIAVIKQRFYWVDLEDNVRKYISSCAFCSYSKDGNKRLKANVIPIKSSRPFDILCADICGPFNRTSRGNRYVLGMIDHFSKNVVLVPLKSTDASTVSNAIFRHWLIKYGMPKTLLTDNAMYFNSTTTTQLAQLCGITQRFSPPYHQQANGLIERTFQTIKPLISASALQHRREWDDTIPTIEMALRCSKQETTKNSPFQILHGAEMRLPADWIHVWEKDSNNTPECYLKDLKQQQQIIFDAMNYRTPPSQHHNYLEHSIKVGDLVLVKQENLNNHLPKLKYRGPFKVLRKIGSVIFEVQCVSTGKLLKRHVNDLKLTSNRVPMKTTPTREAPQDIRKTYPLRSGHHL